MLTSQQSNSLKRLWCWKFMCLRIRLTVGLLCLPWLSSIVRESTAYFSGFYIQICKQLQPLRIHCYFCYMLLISIEKQWLKHLAEICIDCLSYASHRKPLAKQTWALPSWTSKTSGRNRNQVITRNIITNCNNVPEENNGELWEQESLSSLDTGWQGKASLRKGCVIWVLQWKVS